MIDRTAEDGKSMKRPTLQELSLREKIGQTGVAYPAVDLKNPNEPFGIAWSVGGLKMAFVNMDFTPNENLKMSADAYAAEMEKVNACRKIPVLSAMDCNYGIDGAFYEFSPIVSAPLIGAADDEQLAFEIGKLRGLHLRRVCCNWWWGPEVDLASRFSQISYGRLYSDEPERMTRMARAEMLGCQSVGVAATAKHFPGADEMEYRDAHTNYQMLHCSFESWKQRQGKIYQELIDSGVMGIMSSHMAFPACDPTKVNGKYVPASASYKMITELLKGEMGFRGVVVTDAVKMLGLCRMFGRLQEVYIAALKAGNDAILGVDADYIDVVEAAVKRGEISEERINDACQRVLDMKERVGLFNEPTYYNTDEISNLNQMASRLNKLVADKAITLNVNRSGLFPLKKPIHTVHIVTICSDPAFKKQIQEGLATAFEKRGVHARVSVNLYSYDEIEKIANESDLIIYACCRRRKHCYFDVDNQESFNFVLHAGAEKSVGVSFGDPYIAFDQLSCMDTFINAYSMAPEAHEAVADAILGNISFRDTTPFAIIPKNFQNYEHL